MAHISTGSIVADIRGKVGSEIYSRNRGGSYVKGAVSPTQPNTTLQTDARAVMAQAVNDWQSLSDQERALWDAFASTQNNVSTGLGSKRDSGYTIYVRRKMVSIYFGDNFEPAPIETDFSTTISLVWHTLTTSSMRFSFNCNPQSDIQGMMFYFSPPVSSGRMSPNSVRFVYFPTLIDAALSGLTSNFISTYLSMFNLMSIPAGAKVWIKGQCVNIFKETPPFQAAARVYEKVGAPTYQSGIIQA